jgi:hypothetical protein
MKDGKAIQSLHECLQNPLYTAHHNRDCYALGTEAGRGAELRVMGSLARDKNNLHSVSMLPTKIQYKSNVDCRLVERLTLYKSHSLTTTSLIYPPQRRLSVLLWQKPRIVGTPT